MHQHKQHETQSTEKSLQDKKRAHAAYMVPGCHVVTEILCSM